MPKTIYIDVRGVDARTAHRLVIPTLTHYGFVCMQASTRHSRNVAQVRVIARHCANDHAAALQDAAAALPQGTRAGIDPRNPFAAPGKINLVLAANNATSVEELREVGRAWIERLRNSIN